MLNLNQRENKLFFEELSLEFLAQQYGTPSYLYSAAHLDKKVQSFVAAFAGYPTTICYAVKASSNLNLLKRIFSQGIGADTVSLGEIKRALKSGCPPEKIVFSGVGKSGKELKEAVRAGIKSINIESLFELELLGQIAQNSGQKVAIAIRVNLDIEAPTHDKIATGSALTKFGVALEDLDSLRDLLRRYPNLQLKGFACHLGSQIKVFDPIKTAGRKLSEIIKKYIADGFDIEFIDLGGGLGISYQENEKAPSIKDWAHALIEVASSLNLELVIEPGRSLVADAGILISSVLGIKKTKAKNFLVIDAAMNDLMRPTLYEAYHHISCDLKDKHGSHDALYDVVGPVCETGDYIAIDRILPDNIQAGDLVAIHTAGAYGASMASNYNSRLLLPEILVDGDQSQLIRARQTYEHMWANEIDL